MSNPKPPSYRGDNFDCPHCGVRASQSWGDLFSNNKARAETSNLKIAFCEDQECGRFSLWLNGKMIYPREVTAQLAHEKMPEDVREIYNEAREVSSISKRAAAALLRVSLENLTVHLGETRGNLNSRIGNLSKKGLPQSVIDSLDIVRITANEGGSHAGEIDLTGKDTEEVVNRLFWLINFVVEKTIAEPEDIQEMFDGLPEGKKKGIEQRDGGRPS